MVKKERTFWYPFFLFPLFSPSSSSSLIFTQKQLNGFKGKLLEPSPLQLVEIFFDTATYDEIERDVKVFLIMIFVAAMLLCWLAAWWTHTLKVTTEAQLGLIGGTMGLLTGFSILSFVEIVYFVIKFLFSLHVFKQN